MIDAKRLKEVLKYDPVTGVFTHLVDRGSRAKAGGRAGSRGRSGYHQIFIDGHYYQAHRLAWLYMTGKWPAGEVDHKNTSKVDNRWCNLREASRAQNQMNTNLYFTNSSGRRGVTWNKRAGKWQAQIMIDGKNKYLGVFDDVDSAAVARNVAAEKQFGNFPRSSHQ